MLFSKEPCHTLCICAFFKNEAPFLREWIEFHRLVGVERFILYNNDSIDSFAEVLAPYVEKEIVECLDWPNEAGEANWLNAQRRAYNHCVKKCEGKTEWLALIDIDEFLVPVAHPDLLSFLSQFEDQPSVGGIKVNWQLYGTSGLKKVPEGQLLIEALTWKAPWDYRAPVGLDNRRFKSIVRPHAVDTYHIHFASLKPGFTSAFSRAFLNEEPIDIEQIRINHYWSRTEDYFSEVKIDRRLEFCPLKREQLIERLADLNQVEDRIMMRFIPLLREQMFGEDEAAFSQNKSPFQGEIGVFSSASSAEQ